MATTPGSDCILWAGAKSSAGYGARRVAGVMYGAHRWAYMQEFGPIAAGLWVLHKCDVRACVNPAHLFLGTNKENMQDKCNKGRQARGEKDGNAKLTEAAVISIRADRRPRRLIAADHGVSIDTVGRICRREAWRHV